MTVWEAVVFVAKLWAAILALLAAAYAATEWLPSEAVVVLCVVAFFYACVAAVMWTHDQ